MNNQKNIESFDSAIGCYGKIIKFEETEKNTYFISLKGHSRFKIINSQLLNRGYLSSNVSIEAYKNDLNELKTQNFKFINDKSLKLILKSYFSFTLYSIIKFILPSIAKGKIIDKISGILSVLPNTYEKLFK